VISITQASGQPTSGGNPVITEKDHCGIEDCIVIDPSRFSARESTVAIPKGLSNPAQGCEPASYPEMRWPWGSTPTGLGLRPFSRPACGHGEAIRRTGDRRRRRGCWATRREEIENP
jgi:hypothetical protein